MMKKEIYVGIGIIALIILLVILKLFVLDDGSKKIELTYKTNGGVPYEWKYEIEDESIVEFVKKYEVENKNNEDMVGAPIAYNYVFKGLKKGTTKIIFKYVSITDGTVDQEETHTVKVDSNKNISLVTE